MLKHVIDDFVLKDRCLNLLTHLWVLLNEFKELAFLTRVLTRLVHDRLGHLGIGHLNLCFLADFREQMQQMQSLGSFESIIEKLPGGAQMQAQLKNVDTGKQVRRTIAIINSMTLQERRFPDVIKASRKKRIAAGSGTQVPDVNRLLKQHMQMQKMMKRMRKGGMANMMRGMQGMLPPGGMPRR
mgnify:CR=1 FL=1